MGDKTMTISRYFDGSLSPKMPKTLEAEKNEGKNVENSNKKTQIKRNRYIPFN